ncbi:MAG: Asp-tRNA(Asn)/Glu-tRNA(Gln) amidotransferase subunit GatC [Ignavibacteriae bacterium]|nr:Asp-tRNA(Asn)/Glu-tRNA(Gln) amidotransferase subunit GatC [Ignavibacteria bacterium]MBI3364204.1 Asp-tRNA(Asn)/Glu-tRNA(Gln) amidotransferase subunit GatC [Ignavibacteriota bacterium]
MAVTISDVEHVAKLARLEFTDAEKKKLTHQLNDILSYVEKLNELDTSNVEPLSQVIEGENVFRDDRARPSLPRDDVLMNAPDRTDEFFKVPKVIGER